MDDELEKPTALITCYCSESFVRRVEVSITYPKQRIIVTHRVWRNDGSKSLDEITDEIMDFVSKRNAQKVMLVDRVLPMSEASIGKCRNCGGEIVRVPWV